MKRNKRRVFVRPAFDGEAQMFFDWSKETPNNEFDTQVATFPSSLTFCAYDQEGPLAFQTFQRPLMLESLALRPGATKQQAAIALRELTQQAVTQAHIGGAGEIYFLGSDKNTSELAVSEVFEELPFKIFRVKVRELSCV